MRGVAGYDREAGTYIALHFFLLLLSVLRIPFFVLLFISPLGALTAVSVVKRITPPEKKDFGDGFGVSQRKIISCVCCHDAQ